MNNEIDGEISRDATVFQRWCTNVASVKAPELKRITLERAVGMASILNHSKIVRTNDPEGQGYCAATRAARTRAACYYAFAGKRQMKFGFNSNSRHIFR